MSNKRWECIFSPLIWALRDGVWGQNFSGLGPRPGIDGLGGLFWSILHNANVFSHHL